MLMHGRIVGGSECAPAVVECGQPGAGLRIPVYEAAEPLATRNTRVCAAHSERLELAVRDGDPRASYAIIEDGRVEVKRIEYPLEETLKSVLKSSLPETARAQLAEVFRTGGLFKPDSGKGGEPSGPPSGG